jgi:hypothetical protein
VARFVARRPATAEALRPRTLRPCYGRAGPRGRLSKQSTLRLYLHRLAASRNVFGLQSQKLLSPCDGQVNPSPKRGSYSSSYPETRLQSNKGIPGEHFSWNGRDSRLFERVPPRKRLNPSHFSCGGLISESKRTSIHQNMNTFFCTAELAMRLPPRNQKSFRRGESA